MRALARATVAAGLATLTLFAAFALQPEMHAAAHCLAPGSVVQFELARNPADLTAIFGAPDSACRPLAIATMDAVNRLDMLAFIPTYTAFCVFAALFLAGGAARPLAAAAVLAALAAAASDYLETATLLSLTQSLDAPDALLPRLQFGAWAKFALLATHAFLCAGLCLLTEKRRWIAGALLLAPAPGVVLAALDHVRFANVMNAGFAAAWVALLVAAVLAALRRTSSSRA